MYSSAWFATFAATLPVSATGAEVDAIADLIPLPDHHRVLDVGCGIGRVVRPLLDRGYDVTGIDISVSALQTARRAAPAARLIALDQRHVGALRQQFDAVLVLWHSLGFGTTADDADMLHELRRLLRPGGRLLLDLYNPDWLSVHAVGELTAARGAAVARWLDAGRLCNEITYRDGTVDRIAFNVYEPDAMSTLLEAAGFGSSERLVWWKPAVVTPAAARYQLLAV